ncbi:MFS transporter [Streptomyces sp. NPDC000151]|uniref:MFS transporter n=1 Tax=Streptomyces sp. NPDC000151 TaxID=3154244 RepID=UPI00332D87E3
MANTAPPSQNNVQLRRAVVGSFIGSVIEYYDFLLYATASAVVFSKIFFSGLDPLAGTVASFGTFAAGYLARPLGGIVFGHYGDRLGRKRMLVTTMTLMGVVSFLIGLLPTDRQVGSWAAVMLVLLRVLQGIAVGGEWGGAVLMSAEHATSRRGLWASFTNAGAPFGMILSTSVLTATSAVVGEQAFLSWGWRVPFLLSIVLLVVGLFIRLRVEETPVFAAAHRQPPKKSGLPLLDVLRRPRNLVLSVGVGLAAFVAQGTLTTFLIAYGVQVGYPRQTVLNALTLSSALAVIGVIGWSALSDRLGRRPVVLTGSITMGVFGFVLFRTSPSPESSASPNSTSTPPATPSSPFRRQAPTGAPSPPPAPPPCSARRTSTTPATAPSPPPNRSPRCTSSTSGSPQATGATPPPDALNTEARRIDATSPTRYLTFRPGPYPRPFDLAHPTNSSQ